MTEGNIPLDPERVDLANLAAAVASRIGSTPARGFVVGRTMLRDAAAQELTCSVLEAERLVDTMIQRGFFRFERRPDGASVWTLAPELASNR